VVRKLNVSYPIYSDSTGEASRALRAYAYPATLLIDGGGKVVLYRFGDYSDITRYLDEHLRKP